MPRGAELRDVAVSLVGPVLARLAFRRPLAVVAEDDGAVSRACDCCRYAVSLNGDRASLTYPHIGYDGAMARKQPKRSFVTRVRSAVTGRFVKSSQAKRSPRTTVTERIPIGRRGKTKKR